MADTFLILATATFSRQYKKIITKDKNVRVSFSSALSKLERSPMRGSSIKKLVGVSSGNGAWRIRMGEYRVRYDIDGRTVILHTIALRKDIYK